MFIHASCCIDLYALEHVQLQTNQEDFFQTVGHRVSQLGTQITFLSLIFMHSELKLVAGIKLKLRDGYVISP